MDSVDRTDIGPCSRTERTKGAGWRRCCCLLVWLGALHQTLIAFATPAGGGSPSRSAIRPVARLTAALSFATRAARATRDDGSPAPLTERLWRDGADQPDSPLSLAAWSGTRLALLRGEFQGPAAAAATNLAESRAKVAMARDVLGALLASAVESSSAIAWLTDGQQLRLMPVFRARGFGVRVAMAW